MNSENLILRTATHAPLTTKGTYLDIADFDGNNINIYEDFVNLATSSEIADYNVGTTYDSVLEKYCTYNGRTYQYINASATMGNLPTDTDYFVEIFPTELAHQKNRDTILDEGGVDEVTANEIRSFIDAGLTSTTNLSISGQTGSSLVIESSTGTDVTLLQASSTAAGLLSATNKVKLDNLSGVNTGDQTLTSLNAEDVDNKVNDFTTINSVLYPTTEAVDAYLTSQIPDLVDSALTGVEIQTNKSDSYTVSSSITYASTKAIVDGLATKQASLGFTAENVANKDTDVALTANSDTKYPSQKAVKTYVDNITPSLRSIMNLSYTGSSLTLGLGTITLPIGSPISNLGWQQGTRLRIWNSATTYMEGQITTVITNPQSSNINVNIDYVIGTGSFITWYVGIAGDIGGVNPRVQTVASSATVTPVSTNDIVTITAQAVGLTLANPTGTFVEGQSLMIRIKDNGTARTIAFDTNYRVIGITLPTTTVISKTMYLGVIYNSTDGKWDILGLNQQA